MSTVAARIRMVMVAPDPGPLWAELRYDPTDPFAVTLAFENADDIAWTFARSLLAAGLYQESGIGDVRVHPDGSRVMLRLGESDDRWGLFALDHSAVRRFVRGTYAAVPRGAERMDLDGLVDALLDGAS